LHDRPGRSVALRGLLNDLGGLEEDVLGDGEAERLRRLEVDHEVERGRLLDREVSGLGSSEDLVNKR
jgi:hypothetical protein